MDVKERLDSYCEQTNYKLLARLPIIVHLNGRNFNKVTSLLNKPFCQLLSTCFQLTLEKTCNEIEGCVFGYSFNDEFLFVIRNDQNKETNPWFDNKIQKINSAITSLITYTFFNNINNVGLDILGDPIFNCHIFTVPNITEACNYIIYQQNKNFIKSLQFACEYELLNKNYNKTQIKELLYSLNIDEKKNLLLLKCNKNYLDYPSEFRRGITCNKEQVDRLKYKWLINNKIDIFSETKNTLLAILGKNIGN